ncbi:hypothetical protein SAMN02745221_01246 [Thermosyntropha lipolytica DSM 11003]|uniref:Uncharacterized protein n=1 Tax=Thermosyntropha lipolytica DSM 11003 TaxID=1123382 RepID=A0A1M5NNE8_9FIRM|nr:hypothetical protein [Thermosyntropha lipolytica]SHG90463.1 hypothetical protein SAMN02745221_01246 [Thermosyntropha lipolytica DSM 11003]
MRKIISLVLLVSLIFGFIYYPAPKPVSASSLKQIDFSAPKPDGKPLGSSMSFPMFEFWHYSGGYWKAGLAGGDAILWDKDVAKAINDTGKIPYEKTIKNQVPLPSAVKEYLKHGGRPESIKLWFEFLSDVEPTDIFVDGKVSYRVTNDYLEIQL